MTESASARIPALGVAETFEAVKTLCNEEVVRSVNGVFEFHLKGKEPGTWYLDLKNNSGRNRFITRSTVTSG